MFVYWQGYEVDGSSTDYNVVVPERELIAEVLRYFLTLKIIDRNAELSVTINKFTKQVFKWDELDKLYELAVHAETEKIFVSASCIHPDQLFPQVRKDLYKLSATRPGAEGKNHNYKRPAVSPFYRPNLQVELWVNSLNKADAAAETYQPDGLVFNQKTLIHLMQQPHFSMGLICGPTFIYEYAAYLVSNLAERFPEIGIDGGLDCAGGFVNGCTYAMDLYTYEKIIVKSPDIAATLQELLAADVFIPQMPSGKYDRELADAKELHLYHLQNIHKASDEHLSAQRKIVKGIIGRKQSFTTLQYETFVQKIAQIECFNSVDMIYCSTCGVKINDKIVAITCNKEGQMPVLEFRVPLEIRQDFVKTLKRYGISVI